jgi:hypothetical protein
MTVTTYKLLRALVGLEAGHSCRSCGESILGTDRFGQSEGVCRPCRHASPVGPRRAAATNESG